MPSALMESVITMDVGAQEPWPNDVKLFQPYAIEQILLPDNANCLAVQAFLQMCGLPFQIEHRANAEFMSPSGKVPFIKCGAFVVSELEPIVQFISNKGITLTGDLDQEQKSDMRAYMSIIHTVLVNAELFLCWCDKRTYNEITKPRNGSVYPWPLNNILTWSKKANVIKKLKILGWYQKTLEDIYQEVENCCQALSERLEGKDFFFGSKPVDLDALLFGHLSSMLSYPYYSNELLSIAIKYPNLISFCKRINFNYNLHIDFSKLTTPANQVEFIFNDSINMINDSDLKIDYTSFVNHTDSNSTFNNGHIAHSHDSLNDLLRNSLSCINFVSNIDDTKSNISLMDSKNETKIKASEDTLNNINSIENSQIDLKSVINISSTSEPFTSSPSKTSDISDSIRENSKLNVSPMKSVTSIKSSSDLVAKEKKMQINIDTDSKTSWDSITSTENKLDSSIQSSHDSLSLELEKRILDGKVSRSFSSNLSSIEKPLLAVDSSTSFIENEPNVAIVPAKKEYGDKSKDTSMSSQISSQH